MIDLTTSQFAVIGAGRLGSSLALALRSRGAHLAGFTCRSPEGRSRAEARLGQRASADIHELVSCSPHLYFIAVPDDVLPEVADELGGELGSARAVNRDAPLVLHTSGATSVAVLSPCEQAGAVTLVFHPLQTFPDPVGGANRFAGAAIAVTPACGGVDSPGASFGFALARSLGARPFFLSDDKRSLYHAAATLACNYFVTLEHQAEQLFIKAGLDEQEALALFLPLVNATLENLRSQGSVAALTGPLSRGDAHTVGLHLTALANEAPRLLPLYRVLGLATLDLVRARGDVDPSVIAELTDLLGRHTDGEDPSMTAATTVSGPVTVVTDRLYFETQGNADMVNLTDKVRRLVEATGLQAGTVTVFFPGATGAVTTLEFEPGVVQDFRNLFDRISSPAEHYEHNVTHPDLNGHAHVRAGLLGPSLVVPFDDDGLCLGRWQEICFVCFDNRLRERTVIVQTLGVR